MFCIFPDSAPFLVSRVLRDLRQSESEYELMFCCDGLFGVLVCCLCSMDEMLIRFSLVFDRWMTILTSHLEPTDGSVAMGCTAPVFSILLQDVLHRFDYTGTPVYRGRLYPQFGLGRCKVHVDIPTHPIDLTMTAWFTTARGVDLDDTLERTAHQAFTEFCERHLPILDSTAIALLPVWNEGNAVWNERVATVGNPELPTHHAGWALMTRYS
jgi:hypothetical protein